MKMSGLTVNSLWPGGCGLEYAFRMHPAFEVIDSFEDRPDAVLLHRENFPRVTWCDDVTKHVEELIASDIVIISLPKSFRPKITKGNSLAHNDALFALMKRVLVQASGVGEIVLLELPLSTEEYMEKLPSGFEYIRINYADYGVPQNRQRILVGTKFPDFPPLYHKKEWRIDPELGKTAPTLSKDEWKYDKQQRWRANRVYGRPLEEAKIRFLQTIPDEFKTPRISKSRLVPLLTTTMPFLFAEMMVKKIANKYANETQGNTG